MKPRKHPAALLVLLALCVLFAMGSCGKAEDKSTEAASAKYPKLLGEVRKTDDYTENELYIWNEITERKVYCHEVIPASYKEGQKLPVIVYVHGYNGSADALISEPRVLAKDGIAGFAFECCGGNKVTPKSDGKEINPSHYSSRATDLETALAYVKTLPYVDTDRIYIYGQSYGGIVCMSTAPRHNGDIAGLMIESSGVGRDGGLIRGQGSGIVDDYCVPDDWQGYLKQYTGDVIICNSEGDTTINTATGAFTEELYKSRENGGSVTYVLCPEGEHAFNSFSKEGQEMTYAAIRAMVAASAPGN
ncbi:MAG: alpha/beta hydrolase [Lachnospiraceae bacterium]|nr:alpha/beta hydrolase [Lachnospiraceae bacterium]